MSVLPIRKGATHKVVLGPFVDVGDGFTPETGVDISTADEAEAILHDNGTVVDISGYTWAAITTADGYYHLTLQSGITNTVGHLTIVVNDDSVCLPVKAQFVVMPTESYDALYGSSSTLLTAADVGLLLEATIATVNSQTSFDLNTPISGAFATDDSWNGNLVTIEDISTGEVVSKRVTDVDQANSRVIIDSAPVFTVNTSDKVRVFREVHPTAALNSYDPPTRTEATTDKNSILDRLLGYVQLLARSDAAIATDRSSELTLINTDEGSGAGDYDNQVDSQEQNQADVAAIKAKTDSLTFTVAGEVDANMQSVDDVTLGESGTGGQGFGSA